MFSPMPGHTFFEYHHNYHLRGYLRRSTISSKTATFSYLLRFTLFRSFDLSTLFTMKVLLPSAALLTIANAALVEYTWNIRPRRSRAPNIPDCFMDRDLLLVDDMNPGPLVRANVGDTVRIIITNHSPVDSIGIHYHGLPMIGQPFADGVPTQSSCSTGPMQTVVSEFIAQNVGTHYWHGHTSLNRLDGLQGAIIIDDPNDPQEQALKEMYDEERIVFLQDWYHRSGSSARTGLDSEPFIWIGNAQSFLVNGLGRFEGCTGETPDTSICAADCTIENYVADIPVEAGKTYRLRIISAASLIGFNFAIANHTMTVVEADGTIVDPVEVANLDLTIGQRYSVLLKADQPAGSYWATTGVRHRNAGPTGYAYIKYGDSAPPTMDQFLPDHPTWDDLLAGPEWDAKLFTKDPSAYDTSDVLSSTPDRNLIVVGTQARRSSDNVLRWAMNNVTMQSPAVPVIVQLYDAVNAVGAAAWPDTVLPNMIVVPDKPPLTWDYSRKLQDEGVSIYNGENGVAIMKFVKGDVVELVLQNVLALNGVAEMHSWHLHGHSFWIVGQGVGTFDPETDPANYNLVNPVRRDTATLWPTGWTALRFKADNVGVWPFHCSQNAHSVMGMGFSVVISPDMLPLPPPHASNCIDTSLNIDDAKVCSLASDTSAAAGVFTIAVATLWSAFAMALLI
jgi:L-ascorbate oxidase